LVLFSENLIIFDVSSCLLDCIISFNSLFILLFEFFVVFAEMTRQNSLNGLLMIFIDLMVVWIYFFNKCFAVGEWLAVV
jgi:hypothetical protein